MDLMKYRKLRIAWSVAWCVVVVLLCLLWVRSYWRLDAVFAVNLSNVVSSRGNLCFKCSFSNPPTIPITERKLGMFKIMSLANSDKRVAVGYEAWVIPTWLPVVMAVAFSAISWLRFRFSLRTALIAMTLVAVGLGAVVWAMRG